MRGRGWSYSRLAVDGLRSIVFHGPSPTLCIASGNVWFDHPRENMASCMSHETIFKLYSKDVSSKAINEGRALLDWQTFFSGGRTCLRLSQYGYAKQF